MKPEAASATVPLPGSNEAMQRAKALLARDMGERAARRN